MARQNGEDGEELKAPEQAPSERERVFDRFYRVPGTPAMGSGLGLAIVRTIASQHGARVSLGSGSDNRGLVVTIEFAVNSSSPGRS